MLFAANWLLRVCGFVVAGFVTFLHPPAASFGIGVQAACYVLIGAALSVIAYRNQRQRPTSALIPGLLTAVAAFGAGIGGGGTILIVFTVATLISIGSDEELPVTLAAAGVSVLCLEVAAVLAHENAGTYLGYPLLIAVGILLGRNRRSYRVQAEQAKALLEQSERVQSEQRRADVLDERARIAREIHDVLAHSLGALGIQVQVARAVLTDSRDVDRALEVLGTAQRLASEGLVETRRAIEALRSGTRSLADELERAAAEHTERYGAPVTVSVDGDPRPLPAEAVIALVRVAQEALVNGAKHAPSSPIGVTLGYGASEVTLTVRSRLDGQGPRTLATADLGYGLTGMRERLLLLRGTLDAGRQGDEWIVTARLPGDS